MSFCFVSGRRDPSPDERFIVIEQTRHLYRALSLLEDQPENEQALAWGLAARRGLIWGLLPVLASQLLGPGQSARLGSVGE